MTVPEEIRKTFPPRPEDLHKYTAGTVTIVGGSHHFVHAPAIAGLGARVAGAGLVHLVVPDASRIAAAVLVPEATFLKQTATCVPPKADVTAIGMGLGLSKASEMLVTRLLSGSAGRFVLDADALAVLANWYAGKAGKLPSVAGQTLVLTPHAGEAARLLACDTGEVQADRRAAVRKIAERYRATVVLKGPHTLVASPGSEAIWECRAGNPFMAIGGMGDLLGGMIAARWAFLAKRLQDGGGADAHALAFAAAAGSVWLHAAASDSIVSGNPPGDPSLAETAKRISSMRVTLERTGGHGKL